MTEKRRRILATLTILLDVVLLGVVARHHAPSVGWALAPLAASLLLGIHDPARPRAPGVRMLATVFAVGAAWLAALLLAGLHLIDAPGAPFFLLAGAVMWLAHAAILAVSRRLRPARVAVVGHGAATHRLREMIAAAPGVREDPAAAVRLAATSRPGTTAAGTIEVLFRRGLPPVETTLPGGVLVRRRETCAEGLSGRVKRIYDVLLALLFLPFMVLAAAAGALAVLISSGRPVFHSHTRLTLGEREFRIWKLRSMVCDAEPGGRPVWPSQRDRRATPLGRWLRRLWMDETPQIANVIFGDLSWVGPRPERPPFAQVLSQSLPRYSQRHRVRGGLTGLAQIEGYVGNTSLRRRTTHDLAYIERWSPWLDVRIVLGTLCQLVRRKTRPTIDWDPDRVGRIP